ncbi:MAG: site-specific integrase [Dysgonamonadaceae bacterium]|jgi:integrase|nr:site-specific integrase [Dysgonamonadaceae bacterium]
MNGQTTIKEFLAEWLERSIRNNDRKTTYAVYRGHVANHINDALGDTKLCDLGKEQVQNLIRKLRDEKGLCGKSVRSIIQMLKTALNQAAVYGYILQNPCDKLRLPKDDSAVVEVFTTDEQRLIETAIAQTDDSRDYGVLIMLYAGLRIGEMSGLKWKNYDPVKRTITVATSLKRVLNYDETMPKTSVVEDEPKTAKSRRTIPVPDFLCGVLNKLRADSNSEYVVSMGNGKYVEPRTFHFIYKRLLKRAGVTYKRPHTNRHVFATRALEIGIDLKTVSELMGHTDCMITANRYTHSLDEQKRQAANKLNMFFETNKSPLS